MYYRRESAHLVKALLERRHHTDTKEQEDDSPPDSEMQTIDWVATKDFTVEGGRKQIKEFIKTWELRPSWIHCLDFLYVTDEEHHTFYHYHARFSTPTPRNPIQGTASVYFVVDISKVKPDTVPVEVRFVVESNRLVHTPGRSRISEKWLADVIDSKKWLQRAVNVCLDTDQSPRRRSLDPSYNKS